MVMLGDDQTLCPGEMTLLTATTNDDVSFGWFRDGEMLVFTEASIIIADPGEYSVLVTNSAGCTAEDFLMVNIEEVPTIDFGSDTSICPKTILVLSADENFASYSWSLDGENMGNGNPELSVSAAGLYTLLVTTAQDCTQSDTIEVDLLPFTTSAGPDTIIMAGDPLQLLATGGISYQWSGPADLSCITCPNPEVILDQTTTFLVEITSADGCETTETLTVTVEEAPEIDVNIVNFLSPNGDGKNDVLVF